MCHHSIRINTIVIKRYFLLAFLISVLLRTDLMSQSSRIENKYTFFDAESWFLFEAYKDALPLYTTLLKIYPNNANFKYRIGQCYLNIPGEKEKAISYLEDAVKYINLDYKEGKFKEKGAPYDALYYLANAYRINNQIDKALETYKLFGKNIDTDIYDTAIVNLQIESCLNARELMSKPLFIKEMNLGDMINESNSEFNPVVSVNEDLIVYAKNEAFYDAILYSTKTNGQWSGPLNMNELLKVDKDLFPTSISSDGRTLYLYSSAEYDGIIYTSDFENGTWSQIKKLNDNINTKFWESHATVSHDNKRLYFTSNRKGTLGGLDIYVSKKDSLGDWGPAENIGPVINTIYNEETPFLSNDDKTIFFSSRGHFNMGGYDVFYSTLLENGEWSVPLNVGYPLNSTDDDLFFNPTGDGYEGYYSLERPQGLGKEDIYRIEIFNNDHPRKFIIKGLARVADLSVNSMDSIKVIARNISDPKKSFTTYTNPKTGEYEFELPHGNYQFTYQGDGGNEVVKDIDLPINSVSESFVLPGTILPRIDYVAELSLESNKNISVANGDIITFPLKVEPGSTLAIEHWLGDSLMSFEDSPIKDSVFVYKMIPYVGNNRIIFKLTDKFNNITSADVFITREKDITQQPVIRPEYNRIISNKQIDAIYGMFKERSTGELSKVIAGLKLKKQAFGSVDDLVSFLKEEAEKKSISPEEVDKLALKVAVMDYILTQAAVDIMANNTTGELHTVLDELDIYKAGLKTWTDIQNYVSQKTEVRISPEELNSIAAAILADIDPSIGVLRDKILVYSTTSVEGEIIRDAVAAVDLKNIKVKDKWLKEFHNEAINRGLTINQFAELMVAISSSPGTDAQQFLNDLIENADEPLKSYLKSIDLKKEKIKTSKDLLLFLMSDKNKGNYPEDALFRVIANVIESKDLPAETISGHKVSTDEKSNLWVLWVLIGVSFIFFIFYYNSRKKKKRD